MALATRCPNCQSMFRVVSDQLKLRGGLVRCGSCRHVFDAISSLSYVEDVGAGVPPAAASATPAAGPPAAPAVAARAHESVRPGATGERAPRPETPLAPAPTEPAATEAERPDVLAVPTLLAPNVPELTEPESATAQDAGSRDEPPANTPARRAALRRQRAHEREPARAAEPLAPAVTRAGADREERDEAAIDTGQAQAEFDAEAPEFLRGDEERRRFSIVFGGGSLLLALLLLAQSLVVFRTEMLTRWPELRPRLVDLCTVFGCTVGWPTRAELLAVIGTELQAVPGTDILELTAVIRNRAAHRVALPAVEVTLTDTQNRTLARKVFAPVDYLASAGEPSARIDEGLGAGSDIVVRIVFEARGLNASGFVVYPFYL